MPGIGDPAIQLFPQQPVHKIALPHAGFAGKALHLTTNPYNFTLGDRELLVTSGLILCRFHQNLNSISTGQNASDIRRLSGVKSGCDILSLFLKWNLLAPTFPDTVDGFPFIDRLVFFFFHNHYKKNCWDKKNVSSIEMRLQIWEWYDERLLRGFSSCEFIYRKKNENFPR